MYIVDYSFSTPEFGSFEAVDAKDRDEAEFQAEQYVKDVYPDSYDFEVVRVIED
jgi:hypothetical protein